MIAAISQSVFENGFIFEFLAFPINGVAVKQVNVNEIRYFLFGESNSEVFAFINEFKFSYYIELFEFYGVLV